MKTTGQAYIFPGKVLRVLSALILFALVACQSTEQFSASALEPGDSFNGMKITTGASEALPVSPFCITMTETDHAMTFNCYVPPSIHEIGIGAVPNQTDEDVPPADAEQVRWKMSLNEQAIDLAAFGTYSFVRPTLKGSPSPVREVFQQFTAWDIVLAGLQPGTYKLSCTAASESETYTWVVNLFIGQPETSVAFVYGILP